MATSIIKSPFKDYIVLVETGSINEKRSEKIAKFTNAYNNLDTAHKMKSFIKVGNSLYSIQNIGSSQFTNFTVIDNHVYIDCINIAAKTFFEWDIKESGTSAANKSDEASSTNWMFGYFL